jgi:hypothetical protein
MQRHVHASASRAIPAAVAAFAVPALLTVALLPGRVMLPAIGLAAIAVAALLALAAHLHASRHDPTDAALWDASGILVFIGCGAAMLSEPESVLNLLGLPTPAP